MTDKKKIDMGKDKVSIKEVIDTMEEKDLIEAESELEGMAREGMVMSSVVIKRLERSRDLVLAEKDIIQAIVDDYQMTLDTCEDVLQNLQEAIDSLVSLELITKG